MTQRQLASTLSEGLRPLGTPELRSFELITEIVEEKFSPVHAALFAEPVRSPYGDKTEWYTGVNGIVTRLADMPEDRAALAKERLTSLSSDIRNYAEALSESSNANDARVAEALLNALQVPNETSVLVVEQSDAPGELQPILIDWASVPDKQTSVPNVLVDLVPPQALPSPPPVRRAAPIPATPTPVRTEAAAVDYALWIMPGLLALVALLMALILYLLFVSCGLRHVPFLNFCPVASDVEDPSRQTLILRNRVQLLEREIAAAERTCQPVTSEPSIGLTWAGPADLDLSLICPDGSQVWFRDKVQASCGAQLEFDENAASEGAPPESRERIVFEDPPEGAYTIRVQLYEGWTTPGDYPFELDINFGGRAETFRGSVSPERRIWQQEYGFSR